MRADELCHAAVVGLAGGQARGLQPIEHDHRSRGYAVSPADRPVTSVPTPAAAGEDADGVAEVDAVGLVAGGGEVTLDLVEVDAQTHDLGEPAAAADDLDQPVTAEPGEVAGAQLVHVAAPRQVDHGLGVAQHDVGSGVDELAQATVELAQRVDAERAAGDGQPDRLRALVEQVGGEQGHPRRRLGLSVHDEQVPAPLAAQRR